LHEDYRIRLLVNHPLGADREKDLQKGSNEQRKRRQDSEREEVQKARKVLMEQAERRIFMERGGAL